MSSENNCGTCVQVTTTPDKPPTDSTVRAGVWWATRPWINTIAVLTLAGTLAGVLMLATYLGQIDRLDLLPQSVASKAGLLLIVMWALVLTGTLLVAVFGSLWFFEIGASTYNHSSDVPTGMPWGLLAGLLLWLSWLGAFFASTRFNDHFSQWTGAFLALLVVIGGVCELVHCRNLSMTKRAQVSALFRGVMVGGTFWFALVMSALAPLCLLVLDPSFSHESLSWETGLACVAISAPAPTIGWISFLKFARGTAWTTVRKNVILVVLMISALGLLLFWRSVALQTLKSNGVYSTSIEQFIVANESLTMSLRSAGFPATSATSGSPGLIMPDTLASAAKVNAFVRFRFGSMLVLCTTPDDPMERPTLKTNPVYRTADNHWSPGHCLDVTTDSVQRVWTYPGKQLAEHQSGNAATSSTWPGCSTHAKPNIRADG